MINARPFRKFKQPQSRECRMTMAVGFMCRDGIVIGADRQVTAQDTFTFPECKLNVVNWANGEAIFAYSGNHDTYREVVKKIALEFRCGMLLKREEVSDLLRKCLKTVPKREQFQMLFGFWNDGDHKSLLAAVGGKVLDVYECEVIGTADSPLTRFLLGKFYDVPHLISVHQARIYAAYFISQAKKYDGEFVGGPIDVYSLDRSGTDGKRCVRILDAGQTPKWEEQVNLIHYWMDVLFSLASDKDNPTSLDQFMERLKQFREWVGGDPIKLPPN